MTKPGLLWEDACPWATAISAQRLGFGIKELRLLASCSSWLEWWKGPLEPTANMSASPFQITDRSLVPAGWLWVQTLHPTHSWAGACSLDPAQLLFAEAEQPVPWASKGNHAAGSLGIWGQQARRQVGQCNSDWTGGQKGKAWESKAEK